MAKLKTSNVVPVIGSMLARTVPQFALASGLSRSRVYVAIQKGELTARRVGKRTMILEHEGMAFLNSQPAATPENCHAAKNLRFNGVAYTTDEDLQAARLADLQAKAAAKRVAGAVDRRRKGHRGAEL